MKSNKRSNVQFSVNWNFALNCTTFWPIARLLKNKRAFGQKDFKRYVELHVMCEHLSGSA